MKYALFFAVLFTTVCSTESYSQYNNSRQNGIDRSIGSDAPRNNTRQKETQDYAAAYTLHLTKELQLDGLQQAVVRSTINENKSSLEEIYKMDVPVMEKKDKILAINNKITAKISQILSKEQNEKYLKMKEDLERKALRN